MYSDNIHEDNNADNGNCPNEGMRRWSSKSTIYLSSDDEDQRDDFMFNDDDDDDDDDGPTKPEEFKNFSQGEQQADVDLGNGLRREQEEQSDQVQAGNDDDDAHRAQGPIVSLNTDRKMRVIEDLRDIINEINPIAILLQDLPSLTTADLKRTFNKFAKNYTIVDYKTSESGAPLAQENITLVRRDFSIDEVSRANPDSNETTKANAHIVKISHIELARPITLVNIYIRPKATYAETRSTLDWVKDSLYEHSFAILMGDVNASSLEWCSAAELHNQKEDRVTSQYKKIKKQRGKLVATLLHERKLRCLNRLELGPTYICKSTGRPSCIDIACVGSKAIRCYKEFELRETWGEHKVVIIRHPNGNKSKDDNTSSTNCNRSNNTYARQNFRKNLSPIVGVRYAYSKIDANNFLGINLMMDRYLENWKGENQKDDVSIKSKMNLLADNLNECLATVQWNIEKRKNVSKSSLNNPPRFSDKALAITERLKRVESSKLKLEKNIMPPGCCYSRNVRNQKKRQKLNRISVEIEKLKHKLLANLYKEECHRLSEDDDDDTLEKYKRLSGAHTILAGHDETISSSSSGNSPSSSSSSSSSSILNISQAELDAISAEKFPFKERKLATERLKAYEENFESFALDISDHEVDQAIRMLRNKRYKGIDGILFRVFLESYKYVSDIIKTICKMSFYIGKIPTACETTLGKLVPKKKAGQFRIVHISTPLTALLELIALKRLEHRFEAKDLYSNAQYGFMAKKGRHDLIIRMMSNIIQHKSASDNKLSYQITSLDIEGAFDNVNQDKLIIKLLEEARPDPIRFWIASYILNRHIIIKHNTYQSERRMVCTGVPQGSSLGPILWNYVINWIGQYGNKDQATRNNASTNDHNCNLDITAFADDIFICHDGGSARNHALAQQALDNIIARLDSIDLRVNPEKCSHIKLGDTYRQRSVAAAAATGISSGLQINGECIKEAESINILGVHITNKLRLKRESLDENKNLLISIRKLYDLNTLNVLKKASDWQKLIDSLIRNIVIYNNIPILALDQASMTFCDKKIASIIKTIFKWPTDTKRELCFLFTNSLTCKSIVEKALKMGLTRDYVNYNMILQSAPSLRLVTQVKDKETVRPAEFEQKLRLYQDPSKILPIIRLQSISSHVGPYFILSEAGAGRTFLTEILGGGGGGGFGDESLLQMRQLSGCHINYPISYFNTMAVLWNNLNLNPRHCKYLATHEDEGLIRALNNPLNHDWRVIELKEQMIAKNWTIIILPSWQVEKIKANINLRKDTPIARYCNPCIDDYILRYNINQDYTSKLKEEMGKNLTSVCRQICNKYTAWQSINPSTINGIQMLVLAGAILGKDGQFKSGRAKNKGDLMEGCESIGCRALCDDSETTIHRMLTCSRFTKQRKNLESILAPGMMRGSRFSSSVEDVLRNEKDCKQLLILLAKCGLNTC